MQRGFLGLLFAIVLSGCLLLSTNDTDSGQPVVVSESRKTAQGTYQVAEKFTHFYAASGDQALFGAPISENIIEPGLQAQYFENVRLEWDSNDQCVRLSRLGEMVWRDVATQAAKPAPGEIKGRFYAQTGYIVPQAFLSFYDAKGGPDFYGYPISDLIITDDGFYVQYFERVRLDWRFEDERNSVRLGPLGEIYQRHSKPAEFAFGLEDRKSDSLSSGQGTTIPSMQEPSEGYTQSSASLTASVKHETAELGGNQTVAIRLADVTGKGIAGVPIQVWVHERQADRVYVAPATNAEGYTWCIFPIGNPPSGYTILVDVVANWQGAKIKARTSYVPWR